jgi:DNA-binding NarL/FixJ family response regulator
MLAGESSRNSEGRHREPHIIKENVKRGGPGSQSYPTILLVGPEDAHWGDLRTVLRTRRRVRIVGDVGSAHEAESSAIALHPDIVIVAAGVANGTLAQLVETLSSLGPASKIMIIGEQRQFDQEILWDLREGGVTSCFAWEDLSRESVAHCLDAVLEDNIVVGSRAVMETILPSVEQRRGPRIDDLVLSAEERSTRQQEGHVRPGYSVYATLWEENPDLAPILRIVFRLAEIGLSVVSSAEALLAAAEESQSGDFLIVDCSRALSGDMARCTSIVAQTDLPVHIVHPRQDVVKHLEGQARGPLLWLPPEQVGLGLLDNLRLLQAAPHAPKSSHPFGQLTTHEIDIIRLVAEGRTNQEIANELKMGLSTVKSYIARIKREASLATRHELMAFYRDGKGK